VLVAALLVGLAFWPLRLFAPEPGEEESSTTVPSEVRPPAETNVASSSAPVDTTVPAESTIPVDATRPVETTTTTAAGAAQLLVSDGESVTWFSEAGEVIGEADIPAAIAFDDLGGGIVYQTKLAQLGEIEGTTVYHLPAGIGRPEPLVEPAAGDRERLMGVFEVEGSPTALVVERRDADDIDEAVEVLLEVDLASGSVTEVAEVGGWESGPEALSWDGSAYVVTTVVEGYQFLTTLGRDGTSTDWSGALPAECFDDPDCPSRVVASGDGARLVFLRETARQTALVVWDRPTDSETAEFGVPPGVLVAPILVGEVAVLNRYGEEGSVAFGTAAVVDLGSGRVTEAPGSGFADRVVGTPIDAALP
jgi:hypothetical protein